VALNDLVAAEELLRHRDRTQLRRLTAAWGILADLSFGDLVLYLRAATDGLVIADHVRPATSQTIYRDDLVGEVRTEDQRPLITEAFSGARVAGEVDSVWLGERVAVDAIPVRSGTEVIAVLAREGVVSGPREAGQLEATYQRVFERFADMLAAGRFPYDIDDAPLPDAPRVGDGVLVADRTGAVEFSSPNGTSALTRSGVVGSLTGRTLADLGLGHGLVAGVMFGARPESHEVEMPTGVVLSLHLLPLIDPSTDVVEGVLALCRDVTDLRRRDRLLLSKDATIREIHHRVKNNLQTISSLLRLQGRRLSEPSAKVAIEESVRRIRSIALVHEILSREAGDDVRFSDVLRPLVRMVEEGLVSPERPVRFEIAGDGGSMASPTATALAVVLTELLQNVVEHAYGPDDQPGGSVGRVRVELEHDDREVRLAVIDDGAGLPEGFDPAVASSLGLSIVTSLVTTELGGTISFGSAGGPSGQPGTAVQMRIPLASAHSSGEG